MQTFRTIDAQSLDSQYKLALPDFYAPLIKKHLLGGAWVVVDKPGGKSGY